MNKQWEELKEYVKNLEESVDDWYTSLRLDDVLDKMEELEQQSSES